MLPVRFEEEVAGQLHQLIVLHVQNFQQRALYPFRQFLQLVMSCTKLPQTVAAEQPAAQANYRYECISIPNRKTGGLEMTIQGEKDAIKK